MLAAKFSSCSTRRTSWASRTRITRDMPTCWCATATHQPIPASTRRPTGNQLPQLAEYSVQAGRELSSWLPDSISTETLLNTALEGEILKAIGKSCNPCGFSRRNDFAKKQIKRSVDEDLPPMQIERFPRRARAPTIYKEYGPTATDF